MVRLFGASSGVTWFILSFYVPLILVSVVLVVWQLYTRRGEALAASAGSKAQRVAVVDELP